MGEKRGHDFLLKYATNKRNPVRTPEDFEQELEERGRRAEEKGVTLFTSGKDQPFILKRYAACYGDLTAADMLNYTNMEWGNEEIKRLGKTLKGNKTLRQLQLRKNQITDISPLAEALTGSSSLQTLVLSENPI